MRTKERPEAPSFLRPALLGLCLLAASDSPRGPSDRVLEALAAWREAAAPEKAWVLTDKEVYLAGETARLAGFVFDGVTHWPGTASAVLYVDLVDAWGRPWLGRALRVASGRAEGDLRLPGDLPPGRYQLRAYTGRMSGFDEGFVFRRDLDVLSPGAPRSGPAYFLHGDSLSASLTLEGASGPLAGLRVKAELAGMEAEGTTDASGLLQVAFPAAGLWEGQEEPRLSVSWAEGRERRDFSWRVPAMGTRPTLRFFPEGGRMAEGLPGRVAFAASLPDGEGVSLSGRVVDDLGRTAAEFSAAWKGLGSFWLTPEPGRSYVAEAPLPGGDTLRAALPRAVPDGLALSAEAGEGGSLSLRVRSARPREGLVVVVHRRGEPVYAALASGQARAEVSAEVPAGRLGSGVLHVTVFDSAARPLAERLWYAGAGDSLAASAAASDTLFGPRSKVSLLLHIASPDSGGALASLAVRASAVDALDPAAAGLRCWLLLGSDLRGAVRDLCSFAEGPGAAHADLLMLTHGWRRFGWEELLERGPDPLPVHEAGLRLSGRVLDAKADRGLRDSPVTVIAGSGLPAQLRTGRDGGFEASGLHFGDSTRVLVQGDDRRGARTLRFELDPVHRPDTAWAFLPDPPAPGRQAARAAYEGWARERLAVDRAWGHEMPAFSLGEVTVTDTRIREEPAPSRLFVEPDRVIRVRDLPLATGKVFEALQRSPSGFRVKGSGSDMDIRNPRARKLDKGGADSCDVTCNGSGCIPLILVDGTPASLCEARYINLSEVEVIEVLREPHSVVYGEAAWAGVISIVTRSGDVEKRTNIHSQVVEGYAGASEFFAPDYGTFSEGHRKPDLRTTLWWDAVLETGPDGRALVEFWTGDRPVRFLVQAQGVDAYGRVAEFSRWITVQDKE